MKFAFVDVQNNNITAEKLRGFQVDNKRLVEYLINVKGVDFVYLYPGISTQDELLKKVYVDLVSDKVIIKPIFYKTYKKPDEVFKQNCNSCGVENTFIKKGRDDFKCNCDVDLTMDVVENLSKITELYFFSGDGDFRNLLEKVINSNIKVYLITSNAIKYGHEGRFVSRMSTKLKELLKLYEGRMFFIEINN